MGYLAGIKRAEATEKGAYPMFFHKQELQFKSTPDKPDAVYARKLQEVLGGQYGEISVAMQYGFQAWNTHIPHQEGRTIGVLPVSELL